MVLVRFSPINDWTLDQDHVRVAETAECKRDGAELAEGSRPVREADSTCGRLSRPPVALSSLVSHLDRKFFPCAARRAACARHLCVLRILCGGAFSSRGARGAPSA